MTHLSLFSGIGGIDLAAHWAGFQTIQFVERDKFCQKVLAKHWPSVPIYDDITTFDATPFRGRVSLVSGGFPCQDISQANKTRTGLAGSRSGLWFEMLRVIEQSRPAWVVAENVRALLGMGIDVCLSGLEGVGYTTRTLVVPAAGVGAWHRRDRCFIVGADSDRSRSEQSEWAPASERELHADEIGNGQMAEQAGDYEFCGACADATSAPIERGCKESNEAQSVSPGKHRMVQDFRERPRLFEPKLCGDIHGIPNGVDRLRALGNAVVPQQVYPLLAAIAKEIQEVKG